MSDVAIQQRYNQAVIEWKATVDEFETAIAESAESDARHKAARARAIVKAKHEEPKAPAVLIEAIADADTEVGQLSLLRLVKNANVDALKQRLAWHRALADNLRTQVVDERAGNAFMSQAGAGPGRTTFEPRTEPPRRPPEPPQEERLPPHPGPPSQQRQAPPQRQLERPAASVPDDGVRIY